MKSICITGAREHNLKNIDLVVPRNKLVCFVGVSGSGKSTLAFDIIAREGQRQYFDSISSFARQYLRRSSKPDIDTIDGLSPTIIISQDRVGSSPRSTVGTLTEAYTYLRLLFSRVGLPSMDSSYFSFNHPLGACTACKGLGKTIEADLDKLLDQNMTLDEGAIKLGDWAVGGRMWSIVKSTGYFSFGKKVKDFTPDELNKLLYSPPISIEQKTSELMPNHWTFQGVVHRMMSRNTKTHRGPSEKDMRFFNFVDCPSCRGERLKPEALQVTIQGKSIGQVAALPLVECLRYVESITDRKAAIIKPRLCTQLRSMISIGIGYLSLNRSVSTLSGGEAQRVKMARQLDCDLTETIYVLDEPSAGLHPQDTDKLITLLQSFRDRENTVLVVEHDTSIIKRADHIIEVGPGGGTQGGIIVAQGSLNTILEHPHSRIAPYLMGQAEKKRGYRRPDGTVTIVNAQTNNLKGFDLAIPRGVLVALTGVSGSGKSSLVEEIIAQEPTLATIIDQQPIGTTKRGCLATYTGAFDHIRKVFAHRHGVSSSLFSFNGQGGCTQCKGVGHLSINMHFIGDITVPCDMCRGQRYKNEVLKYTYRGTHIAEVLTMTASEAYDFFTHREIRSRLKLLVDVGLDYLQLGQTLDTLSGGEAQRLKIASRLTHKGSFYIFDEPSSGLHPQDLAKLLKVFNTLLDNNNTVLVVEHNLQMISQADWIIDLGPGGGPEGGRVIAQGTPREIAKDARSSIGRFL